MDSSNFNGKNGPKIDATLKVPYLCIFLKSLNFLVGIQLQGNPHLYWGVEGCPLYIWRDSCLKVFDIDLL